MNFEHLESFCLFVGPNRSGTTVVGALLDAHPDVLIAHELDVFEGRGSTGRLKFATRDEVFERIARNSARKASKGRPGKRREGRVSYAVPEGHQGAAEDVRVIGTKRAQRTMHAIAANPQALTDLHRQVQLDLRLVHVVRNPFDNIVSMTPRKRDRLSVPRYEWVTELMAGVRSQGWDVHELALEDMIADPRSELERLCDWLGLAVTEAYLNACSAIVMDQPSLSRHARQWLPEEQAAVQRLVDEVPWLRRYQGTAAR